jgi:hypothetical protein
MPKSLTPLQKVDNRINRIKQQLANAQADRAHILSATEVTCQNSYANNFNGPGATPCGKPSQIGKLDFIQMLYYVPPRGCTEGDYWQVEEDDGLFICPHCGYTNRLLYQHGILKLKDFFGSRSKREMR